MLAKQALDAMKMTDREIAEYVGVSERTVRFWRAGGGIQRAQMIKLAQLLRERIVALSVAASALENRV